MQHSGVIDGNAALCMVNVPKLGCPQTLILLQSIFLLVDAIFRLTVTDSC